MRKILLLIHLLLGIFSIGHPLLLSAQHFDWVRGWGSSSGSGWIAGDEISTSITVDREGNILTTGLFTFPTDFDPGPGVFMLSPSGDHDAFVSKIDASGNFLWARRMGGTFANGYRQGSDAGKSIATDTSGNIYVTGTYKETADFGSFTLTSNGGTDVFICKMDASGNFLWAKSVGGGPVYYNANDDVAGLVLDKAANIYLSGQFKDTTDFDPGSGVFNLLPLAINIPFGSSSDMFVLKLDKDGNFIWAKNMGGAYITVSTAIALDAHGNVYTGGFFGYGTRISDFDPGPGIYNLSATNAEMTFICKLDNLGNLAWAKTEPWGWPSSMTGDLWGNVYVTGGSYLAKYNSAASGNLIWFKTGVGSRNEAIATDQNGNIYITGMFDKEVDFNPGTAVFNLFATKQDIFILKLDSACNFSWAARVAGPLVDFSHAIAVDRCENVYTTGAFAGTWDGSFGSTVDFDPGPGVATLTSAGHLDAFVLKLRQTSPPYITVDTFMLGLSQSYATYQWYLNGTPIAGATDSTYLVDENGIYSVAVRTAAGCSDTTPGYKVTNVYDNNFEWKVHLPKLRATGNQLSIYPNPVSDILHISTGYPADIMLTSIDGKTVLQQDKVRQISLASLAAGVYLLYIMEEDTKQPVTVAKIIKQ